MPTESCLIVFAAGKQLDLLRGEASRIAKRNNVDWWSRSCSDRPALLLCGFEREKNFALTCDNFGISCRDG
jgi:hypothetical protein